MPSGPGSDKYWAIAVAQAQKMGYKDFTMTGAGHNVAGKIAEEMALRDKRAGKFKGKVK